MESLVNSILEDQFDLAQKLAELNHQCDRINQLIREDGAAANFNWVAQLKAILAKRRKLQGSAKSSISVAPMRHPVEIREIRFLENEEYLITLVNRSKVAFRNLAICTRNKLELGYVEKLRAADEVKTLLWIPMSTLMRERCLHIYVVSSAETVSVEFPYYVCEVAEPDWTGTHLTVKLRKNVKCPVQAHICFDTENTDEFVCELKLTAKEQTSQYERSSIPGAISAQVKLEDAVLSNLLRL